MTLLRTPQCRLLRAPHRVLGAVQRLQRPALTVPRRFVSSLEHEELEEKLEEKLEDRLKPQFGLSKSQNCPPEHETHLHRNQKLPRAYLNLKSSVAELEHSLTPAIQDSHVVPVDSAIIIPASVAAAKPDHFVDQIWTVPHPKAHLNNLVVFLVTPSFAPWLSDGHIFMEKALAKLYKNLPESPDPLLNIQVVCAVVDRLPEARPVAGDNGRDVDLDDFHHRAQQPPIAETGHEGIAYMVINSRARATQLPTLDGEIGCIDFLAHTSTDTEGRNYTRIRLPLANTVFQTGKPSTLVSSHWKWSRADAKPVLESRRDQDTAVINLSTAGTPSASSLLKGRLHQEAPVLSIPLLPLTMPRQVDGHMGNIIRGIIGPDDTKRTASTELEQVVPRFFKSRGEPAQATSAWALVIPKNEAHIAIKDTSQVISSAIKAGVGSENPKSNNSQEQHGFESLWQQQPLRWNVMVQEALMRGARLHKVLSGGGGWGKKAGLLSLDPVPIGPPYKGLSKTGMADDYDSVDEFSTALKPVVEDGDFIQFFISAVPVAEGPNAAAFTRLKDAEISQSRHNWSWEFGVVPSTVDSIPGGSWQHTGKPSEEMAVFRGTFGALSERGLTLMYGRNVNEVSGMATEDLNTTMVDVPFSRWSALRIHPRDGVKTGIVGDSHKNTMPLLRRAMQQLEQEMESKQNAVHAESTQLNCPNSAVFSPRGQSETTGQADVYISF